MTLFEATTKVENSAAMLLDDLAQAVKVADKLDPWFGWQLERIRGEAFLLKNRVNGMSNAARRRSR